jgi:hypothetical protein
MSFQALGLAHFRRGSRGGFCDDHIAKRRLERRGTAFDSRFDDKVDRSADDEEVLHVVPPHEAELAIGVDLGRLHH